MSPFYLMLEAWEEKITMAIWTEHSESLPPKIKLTVPLNLQFPKLDLKELSKELKYTLLEEGKTFFIIILYALDDI